MPTPFSTHQPFFLSVWEAGLKVGLPKARELVRRFSSLQEQTAGLNEVLHEIMQRRDRELNDREE